MFAFVLLFALAFAQGEVPPTCDKPNQQLNGNVCECINGYQVNTDEATKVETPCVCPTDTHTLTPATSPDAPTTCVEKPDAQCDADKYIKQTENKKACECMETFTPKQGVTEMECECVSPNEIKDVNGVKTCVELPNCDASKHQQLNGNECKCINGYVDNTDEETKEETPCVCPEDTHYEKTEGEGDNEVMKCIDLPTCDKEHQQLNGNECKCINGYVDNTDEETKEETPCICPEDTNEEKEEGEGDDMIMTCVEVPDAQCDAAKYIKQTENKKACECMETFTEKAGANPFECECVSPKQIKDVNGVKQCVEVQEAQCDAAKYVKQSEDKKSCVCMDTFTEKAGSNPFECQCTGKDMEVKDVNGVKKCVKKEEKKDNGVNGLFLILAMVIFFIF